MKFVHTHLVRKSIHRQNGWALLESAVSLGLLATIILILGVLFQKAGKDIDDSSAISPVSKGDIALVGYFLVHKKLPPPENQVDSPRRPHYKEGWLPLSDLGISKTGGRVRYLVHESLIGDPPIYNVDPAEVTSRKVIIRKTRSFADPCANLFKLETSGASLPGTKSSNGLRAGYVLQQIRESTGQVSPVEKIWPGDAVQDDIPPADLDFTTTALGFNELAGELGCFNYMPKLAASVKTAGIALDLAALARMNVDLQSLEIKMLDQKIKDLVWREANWSVALASFLARGVVLAAGTIITPPSWPWAVTSAPFLVAMAGAASYIVGQTAIDLEDALKELVVKKRLLDEARRTLDVRELVASQAVKDANELQALENAL